MSINLSDLNRAIILYLGFGFVSSPHHDRVGIIKEFGVEKAAKLEGLVKSLIDELGRIDVDWSIHTLESAGELARIEMHHRYPDLSDEALRALEWKFTYDWR